jgi:hypothetical protein
MTVSKLQDAFIFQKTVTVMYQGWMCLNKKNFTINEGVLSMIKMIFTPYSVIPAQAGIQAFQPITGSPFSRG